MCGLFYLISMVTKPERLTLFDRTNACLLYRKTVSVLIVTLIAYILVILLVQLNWWALE